MKETQVKLDRHTQTLDTLILIRLDTRSLRNSQDLDTLDRDVRGLALRIEQGVNTTARLLADQASQILDHFDQRFDERERCHCETEIDQARERFKNSVFFPDIEAREDEVKQAFEGTCRWVFDPPMDTKNNAPKWHNFQQWLEIGEAVYWISGKPGSGKSTLMKYIVEEPRTAEYLSEWKRGTELIIVTFFFKDLGTELQKSATGLLRSIIWQITRYWPGMINLVLRRYGQSKGQSPDPSLLTMLPTWTETRLLQMLKDFINEKPAAVSLCAFIDGLDEYDGDEELLFEVIRLLSSASGCKVCVSGRPDQAFRTEFEAYPQCRVQDLSKKDIEKMAIEKLKPCLVKYKPTETEAIDELVDELIQKAEGVFLWSSIMIKDLSKRSSFGDSIDELRDRLHETPSSMYGLYQRMLQRLDRSYLAYAFKIFQILIAAEPDIYRLKPSNLLGLACGEQGSWVHVTQLDHSYFCSSTFNSTCRELRSRINARCGNLIEIENESEEEETIVLRHRRAIKFIHRTAVEFLKEEYDSTFSRYSCLASAWVRIARLYICLIFFFPSTQLPSKKYELQAGLNGDKPDGESPLNDDHGYRQRLESDLAGLVTSTMTVISFGERFAANTDFRKPLHNLQSKLTEQTWQTLRYIATTDDASTKIDGKYYDSISSATGTAASGLLVSRELEVYDLPGVRGIESLSQDLKYPNSPAYRDLEQNATPRRPLVAAERIKQLLKRVERDLFKYDNTEAGVPFQDDMNFAAFWGCDSYIRARLSPKLSDEQLEGILRSVVLGMDQYLCRYIYYSGLPTPWVNIVDVLLHAGQISRVKTNVSKHDKHSRSSLWGALFAHICQVYKMAQILDPPGLSGERKDGLFGERAAWTQRCHNIIERFLSLGADCNTRICHGITVRPPNGFCSYFFADWTPLAIIQSVELRGMEGPPEIETILKSKGAVNQTRYRSLLTSTLTNATYYRIGTTQAKGLDDLLFSKPRIHNIEPDTDLASYRTKISIEADDEVFDVIEGIISTDERLDRPTMDNKWAADGSEWLEDNHEPET